MGDAKFESPETPKRLLVAGVIVRDGKILLAHNIKHGLRIEPPGGKVHPGEMPEDALRREVQEELGMEVEVVKLLGIYHTSSPEGDFPVYTFVCTVKNGEPMPDREPGKIGHFAWFTPEELCTVCTKAERDRSHLIVPNLQAALGDILEYIATL